MGRHSKPEYAEFPSSVAHQHNHRSFEQDMLSSPEFISRQSAEQLVIRTLFYAGRIDQDGRIQPLEVRRRIYDPGMIRGPAAPSGWRDDIVMPTDEQKTYRTTIDGQQYDNSIPWDIKSRLYAALTNRYVLTLDEPDVLRLASQSNALEATLDENKNYHGKLNTDQSEHAYHIYATKTAQPDFAKTRLYIPGGTEGADITRHMIDIGAQFSYAKTWIPEARTGQQRFRHDTPIFEVVTYDQLRSTMGALRQLKEEGILSAQADAPVLGQPIDGLAGVFVGQTAKDQSFNGTMAELFADPITKACTTIPLPGDGKSIDTNWVEEVAARIAGSAQERATQLGVNPRNHAFLVGQPVDEIMGILAAA